MIRSCKARSAKAFRQGIIDRNSIGHPAVGTAVELLPVPQVFPEAMRREAGAVNGPKTLPGTEHRQKATTGAFAVEAVQQEPNLALGDRLTEMVCGDRLQGMGFVDHHELIRRQDRDFSSTEGQMGHQQCVIHHQNLGMGRPAASPLIEAGVVMRAGASETIAVLAPNQFPDTGIGHGVQLGERTFGRLVRPVLDSPELVTQRIGKQRGLSFASLSQSANTQVVVPPLDQDGSELFRSDGCEERHVFLYELFLEGNRMGADNDPLVGLGDPLNGRYEVG
ncbi:MAG TPA: hypothetical protein PLL20_18655, partial [Phycisphaerae bacterium]|nr:hypothetical protein [Phycisphaerae bacterium]